MIGYVEGGGVVAGCFALAAVAGRASGRGAQHDPQRALTPVQRQAIFARAGGRCEHFGVLGVRCRHQAAHADHVVPWSRGGASTLANAQALCARRNLAKGAGMPTEVERGRR